MSERRRLAEYPPVVRQIVWVYRAARFFWPITVFVMGLVALGFYYDAKHDRACAEMRQLAGQDSTRLQRAVAFCAGKSMGGSTYTPIYIPYSPGR